MGELVTLGHFDVGDVRVTIGLDHQRLLREGQFLARRAIRTATHGRRRAVSRLAGGVLVFTAMPPQHVPDGDG